MAARYTRGAIKRALGTSSCSEIGVAKTLGVLSAKQSFTTNYDRLVVFRGIIESMEEDRVIGRVGTRIFRMTE